MSAAPRQTPEDRDQLLAQRDKLLAALKHCSEWAETYGNPETRAAVRAAIARATGEKS